MSRRPPPRPARPRPALSRARILATAADVLAAEGLGALTNARLAERLGVTPAAIRWHARTRDEILEALVEAACAMSPPEPHSASSWRQQLIDLVTWLRKSLLACKELVREPACWGLLLLGYAHVELRAGRILRDAGFGSAARRYGSRTLVRHTFVFVYQELMGSSLAVPSLAAAFEAALAELPPNEHAMIRSPFGSGDRSSRDLFRFGIDAILDGLEDDRAHPEPRARRRRA